MTFVPSLKYSLISDYITLHQQAGEINIRQSRYISLSIHRAYHRENNEFAQEHVMVSLSNLVI